MTLNQGYGDFVGVRAVETAFAVNRKPNIQGTNIKDMGRIEALVSLAPISVCAIGLAAYLSASICSRYRPGGLLERVNLFALSAWRPA
jgi:hypothetical protein